MKQALLLVALVALIVVALMATGCAALKTGDGEVARMVYRGISLKTSPEVLLAEAKLVEAHKIAFKKCDGAGNAPAPVPEVDTLAADVPIVGWKELLLRFLSGLKGSFALLEVEIDYATGAKGE